MDAIAITNHENAQDVDGARGFASGHPQPDQNGLKAGIVIMRMLESASRDDTVVSLISGGGSALLPKPRMGISLDEKILSCDILLSDRLDNSQTNTVRQQLSVLKGGGLSAMAHPAKVRSLIISDVVGDDISAIASGPTAPAMDSFCDIDKLLKQSNLWPKLPCATQTLLAEPRTFTSINADNRFICSNLQSL